MKSPIFRISLLLLFSTVHAQFGDVSHEQIAVSFAALYPTSPLKKVKVLATQLWAEANAATQDNEVKQHLENSIVNFTHTVLDLYTQCEALLKDIQLRLNGTSMRYQHKSTEKALEDLQYLTSLVGSLEGTFDRAMEGHVSDQAACVKVVLEYIRKKMERTLQSAP